MTEFAAPTRPFSDGHHRFQCRSNFSITTPLHSLSRILYCDIAPIPLLTSVRPFSWKVFVGAFVYAHTNTDTHQLITIQYLVGSAPSACAVFVRTKPSAWIASVRSEFSCNFSENIPTKLVLLWREATKFVCSFFHEVTDETYEQLHSLIHLLFIFKLAFTFTDIECKSLIKLKRDESICIDLG